MPFVNDANVNKTYLSIAYGKFRQKRLNGKVVDANTPKAVNRVTQKGEDSWAIEQPPLVGKITGLFYKPAQTVGSNKYPASYELIVDDMFDVFQISLKDEDSIAFQLLGKFLNINLKEDVYISPYDFKNKEGKSRKGLTLKQNPATKDGVEVNHYFITKKDEKWVYSHGFPEPPAKIFEAGNERKRDMYNLEVADFYKKLFDEKLSKLFSDTPKKDYHLSDTVKEFVQPTDEGDSFSDVAGDLPF
jgi:hypothetical protein